MYNSRRSQDQERLLVPREVKKITWEKSDIQGIFRTIKNCIIYTKMKCRCIYDRPNRKNTA